MKKIHYKNIGYPKTGTNWLWLQLMSHPEVDAKFYHRQVKKEFVGENLQEYKSVYEQYNISVNLDPNVFINQRSSEHFTSPRHIHKCATHLTVTFRNLYEVLNSLFNMEKNREKNFKMSKNEFIQSRVGLYCDMKKIFKDWEESKLPVKYLFYDDLVNDPKSYVHDIYQYIGLKPFYIKGMGVKFKTDKKDNLVFEDRNLIKYINDGISVIEDHTNRDLSHWKTYGNH